eukprot:3545401-Amphidinium_carterae.1
MVGRQQGAQVVMNLGKMAASGVMTADEFKTEVADGKITNCKMDEVFHMSTLSDFVAQEETCPESMDMDDCLNKEQDSQQAMLSRASTGLGGFIDLIDVEPRQCTCLSGSPILQQQELDAIVEKAKIRKSPTMMFEAAMLYCNALGSKVGIGLRPTFNKGCAPQNFGYCCSESTNPKAHNRKREARMMKGATDLAAMVERVIQETGKLYDRVKEVQQSSAVKTKHKVMMYKLYIVHFHHSQVFIKRHQYCVQNPDDLEHCEESCNIRAHTPKKTSAL